MINTISHKRDVDILLIYPKTGVDLGATIAAPHSLLTIAAPLHAKGYKVKILDQRTDALWKTHLIEYLKNKPICIGISSMIGTQIYFAIGIAKIIRRITNGTIPIIWGGPQPSIVPEQTLRNEYVDAVCIGEGEVTFMEMVEAFQGKKSLNEVGGIAFKEGGKAIITPSRPLIDVETLLPVPWELIDVEKYIHRDFYIKGPRRSLDIGQTSRGCPFQCGFCSSAAIRQRRWRAMSVNKSLERILEPIKRFNLDGIWIRDDEFYIDRNRTYEICEGIVKSGFKIKWYTSGTRVDIFNKSTDDQIMMLKRSGAGTLKFGAESGSNKTLELMKKDIRCEDTIRANLKAKKFGITPAFGLMVGLPGETFDDINRTVDLLTRLKRDNPMVQFDNFGTFIPLPGTPLYELALKMGLRPPDDLEGWSNWLGDEYDIEGRRLPWFSYFDRKKLGNLAYMSILACSTQRIIGGVENNFLRSILSLLFTPISSFERIKLKRKWYAFAPELNIARYLRRRLFYRSHWTIR